jgi:hypothetical protein
MGNGTKNGDFHITENFIFPFLSFSNNAMTRLKEIIIAVTEPSETDDRSFAMFDPGGGI